jgi:flavin-dependent dehydrogenase
LITDILHSCGRAPPADLQSAHLHGTGLLTRHRQMLGGHRVLTIGDACGYVEPFTGEGMAWAITSAIESSRLLLSAGGDWPVDLPARWRNRYFETTGHRQRWCRAMRPTMHHPFLAHDAIRIGSVLPMAAQWIAGAVNRTKEIRDDNPGRFPLTQIASRIDARDPRHRHRQPPVRPAGIDA